MHPPLLAVASHPMELEESSELTSDGSSESAGTALCFEDDLSGLFSEIPIWKLHDPDPDFVVSDLRQAPPPLSRLLRERGA